MSHPQNGAGLLLRHRHTFFVARRAPHVHSPGLWDVIGGGVEGREAPLDAALREFIEEMGGIPRITVTSRQQLPGRRGVYTVFHASCHDGRWTPPQTNDENDAVAWLSKRELVRDESRLHPKLRWALVVR